MKPGRKTKDNRLIHQLLILIITLLMSATTFANPVVDHVASGQVQIQQAPNSTVVNQSSQKAIINWQSFNIGAAEKTHFQQPTGGVALNRINPQMGASQIYGSLSATGKIILVNQAGIFFGPGSRVDVGGLIASTRDISDADFLAGKYQFNKSSSYNGSIINQGTIHAAENGLVALVGNGVRNDGTIEAHAGNIVLASGNKFTIDMNGDQLINFSVDEETTSAGIDQNGNKLRNGVKNTGALLADGGTIIVTARVARDVVDHAINMKGVAQARSVSQKNGVIILDGGEGNVKVAANIDVSGKTLGSKGGTVKILGKNVHVKKTAVIDASGDVGGGEILIGGNYQGKGPERNAYSTLVDQGAIIKADAIRQGDGGKVIVWADNDTTFQGHISAQGGASGGNGGFAEVSGHNLLSFQGTVNLLAPHGLTGTLLLDPNDLVIQAGGTTTASFASDTYSADVPSSILTVADLESALAGASILVTTGASGIQGGTITVSDPVTWSNANSLTLNAFANVTLNAAITNTSTGDLTIISNSGGLGGNITLNRGISLTGGDLTFQGGNVTQNSSLASVTANSVTATLDSGASLLLGNFFASNSISNLGAISASGGVSLRTGTSLTATGNINADGGIFIFANSYTQNANVDLVANGGITILSNAININNNTGGNAFQTTGELRLQTAVASTAMSLAGAAAYDLSANEITQFISGLSGSSSLIIGNSLDTTGSLTVGGAVNFNNINTSIYAGSFNSTSAANVISTGTGTLTLGIADANNTGNAIGSSGNAIQIDAQNLAVTTYDGDAFIASTNGTNISSASSLGTGSLTLTMGGAITQSVGADITASALNTTSVGGTLLTNAGNAVSTFSANNSSSGDIQFTTAMPALTISGISQDGTGDVLINNTGGSLATSGAITTTGSGNIGLTANTTETINNAINSTSGSITFTGSALNLGADVTTTGGNINFNNPVTLISGVAVNSGTGNTTFSNTITGGGFALATNTSSSGITTFDNTVSGLSSLTATGLTTINTSGITTSGAQTYNNAVTLGANTTLSSTSNGTLAFNSVDGGFDLTLNTGGNVILNSAIGSTSVLNSLDITGNTTVNNGPIITSGNQVFHSPISLAGVISKNFISQNGDVTFGSTLNGARSVTASASNGTVEFDGIVGGTTPLSDLFVFAQAIDLKAPAFSASVKLNFTGATVLEQSTTFNALEVDFLGGLNSVSSSSAFDVTTGPGSITIFNNGDVGNINPLGTISTERVFLGSNITTTGDQIYNGNALVENNAILTGNNIQISGDVQGDTVTDFSINGSGSNSFLTGVITDVVNLNLNGSGTFALNNASALNGLAGGVTSSGTLSINNLTTNAALTLNGGTLLSAGTNQLGAVTLNASSIIETNSSSDTLTITGAIDGANGLVLQGAGSMIVNGAIGNGAALTSLTSTVGSLSLGGGAVQTVGNQNYTTGLTLTADTNLSSSSGNIAIQNGIAGANSNLTLTATQLSLSGTLSGLNTVSANGNGGTNNLTVATTDSQQWNFNGADQGTINNMSGMNAFQFNNIQNIAGGSGTNNFIFNGGSLSGSITGGSGTNTLTVSSGTTNWIINGTNTGNVTGVVGGFSNIQNLTGGTGTSTFSFLTNGTISGLIDGGNTTNTNILDFSNYGQSVALTLSLPAPGSTELNSGTIANNASFTQIQKAIGSSPNDTLTLPNKSNLVVVFTTPTSGYVGDPFFFDNFTITNVPPSPVPPPVPPEPGVLTTDVAKIITPFTEDSASTNPTTLISTLSLQGMTVEQNITQILERELSLDEEITSKQSIGCYQTQ